MYMSTVVFYSKKSHMQIQIYLLHKIHRLGVYAYVKSNGESFVIKQIHMSNYFYFYFATSDISTNK
jgi:hypothetical protein